MSFVGTAIVVGAGATVYAGKKAGEATRDAASEQSASAAEAQQFQQQALDDLRRDLDPFKAFGSAALDPLSQQLGFGGFQQDPTIQGSQAYNVAQEQTAQDEQQQKIDYLRSMGVENPTPQQIEFNTSETAASIQRGKGIQTFEEYQQANPLPDRFAPSQTSTVAQQNTGITSPTQQTYQQPTNELLDVAMQERMDYDPMSSPLLAQAQQQRLDYDPLANPLLQSAQERQMAFDPMANMGPGLLQNPLLQAMQEDVTRRLMANQAARGKLGSGGTAESLQQRLVPQAITFGLQMNELQRQDIADRQRMGMSQVGLQQQQMAGQESLGFGLDQLGRQATTDRMQAGLTQEDLAQRQTANLFDAARLGQASAAQTGQAGMSAASQMGNLSLAQGQAQAAGTLGAAQARNQMIGGLAGMGMYGMGQFQPTSTLGTGGLNTQLTGGFQPTTAQFDQYLGL
jgi:hypothetical protein